MHHFVSEMCTFLLQNGAWWDMGLVHCGICATGQCGSGHGTAAVLLPGFAIS